MSENSTDEIEICQDVEPHEDEDSIKSKAVVKFSVVEVPAKFNRLQCNTDLNLPPSNWLSTSPTAAGLHRALYHSPGFSSFRMAHMFPDCLGDVDVVSDAENIKKLLKLPYNSKSVISMMVHKVGNTLLIDEFDIQKYLMRKADDDWKWLRSFILGNIIKRLDDKERNICLKDKSREAIQTKNLLSKFLYYSLQKCTESDDELEEMEIGGIERRLPITGPVLPEPNIEEKVPDPNSNHVFNRNVVWTFEDIRMLIGTDMPIFGGPNRPCISLRLRDMNKPINVLTGIDYWLDNLMCNVPEVVMCYHLDGVVQKYEMIKTEDLPYLENSKFSPQVVRNVAQNILSFLKANATKAGHTYWLFKGKNDEVVKLYDLTTLCKNANGTECDPKSENPFTVPVAMLLYTVARNMKNTSNKLTARKAGSIRALLDNCIKLLPKEKFPQIVTSSHYILSDLHIPAGLDPKSPRFDSSDMDSDTQSVYEDDTFTESELDPSEYRNEDEDDFMSSDINDNVAVQSICDTLKEFHAHEAGKDKRSPLPLIASTEERCKIALEHISEGIDCLQYFNTNEEQFVKETEERAKAEEKQRIIHEEQHPNMARPHQPIPLPYESLTPQAKMTNPDVPIPLGWDESNDKSKKKKSKKSKTKEVSENEHQPEVSAEADKLVAKNFNLQSFGSWNVHLKLLLLEKACLTYATQAETNYELGKFGACLRCIYMAFRCQQVVMKYMSTIASQKSCMLGRAGDCFFRIDANFEHIDQYIKEFEESSEVDSSIFEELEKDLDDGIDDYFFEPTRNNEQLLLASCRSYEIALESASGPARSELIRRLGNARNELAVKYMYWAQDEYKKFVDNLDASSDKTENSDDQKDGEEQVESKGKEPIHQVLMRKSYDSLIRGIAAFEEQQDTVNLTLLYCNMGRFYRLRAYVHFKGEEMNDLKTKKIFYNEAFSFYEKAQTTLGSRKQNPDLWDHVNWELSTAVFSLAKLVQDSSSVEESASKVAKEVVELLQKSLKLCDVEHATSRQVLYTYRSGLIHRRLASFYHHLIRENVCDQAQSKTNLQLCRFHYERAATILEGLKEVNDFLTVQLERIALQESLAESTPSNNQKIKHLQIGLDYLLTTKSSFEHFSEAEQDTPTLSESTSEIFKNLKLFENRLQHILKNLIKLCRSGKDPKNLGDAYKQMYLASLNVAKIPESDTKAFAKHLSGILEKIGGIKQRI